MTRRIRAGRGDVATFAMTAGVAIFAAMLVFGSSRALLLVAAPFGAIALMFAAQRPLLALSIMVAVEFTNLSGLLAEKSGIPIFPASLLMGLLAVAAALRDRQNRSRINGWTAVCAALLLVYLATQAIAMIGSVDPAVSAAALYRHGIDCVFVMVVLILIQITARPWTVAAVIVVTLSSLCALTLVSQIFYDGAATFGGLSTVTRASGEMITTRRYGGPLPDSNFWGRHLVMGLPMAAALTTRALRARRSQPTATWMASTVLLLGGVYLTQSRGTFLAAGVAITVWFIAVEGSVRRWSLILVPLGVGAFAMPGVGDRIVATVEDFLQADERSNIDPSIVQRLAAQQEAWMMFDERPVFGFGPATFPGQVINFAGRVPTAAREPTDAPHNLYAELAAESGWVGLTGWAVMILGFLGVVVLGILAKRQPDQRVLAAAVCAGIVAWSVASIGLQIAYFRTFGVVLALAGGLAPAWPIAAEPVRTLLRGVALWSGAALCGSVVFWTLLSANSSAAVTARQPMTLVPVGQPDGSYAYALDIRSRIEFLPTFATLLHQPRSSVDIVADPVRGVLVFTATAEDGDRASDAIDVAVAQAQTSLHSAIGYQQYSLQTVGSMRVEATSERPPRAVLGATAAGVLVTVISGVVSARALTRRRPDARLERAEAREATFAR